MSPPVGQRSQGLPLPDLWILEDDPRLCDLLIEQCALMDWCLQAFLHPRAMEEALEEQTPALLLLDQMLPGTTGTHVLARLRHQGHRFPVLMLSALGAPSDRIAGLEAGADDYLAKPFLFRELELRIARLLASRGPERPEAPLEAGSLYDIDTLRFDPRRLELTSPSGEAIRISRGDSALLLALCRRPREVVSRRILAAATGSLVDPSQSRTIDVRLSRLRRLLSGLLEGEEPIRSLRGKGYMLQAEVREIGSYS